MHTEALVQDCRQGQRGADHLAAALEQTAVDFDVLLHYYIFMIDKEFTGSWSHLKKTEQIEGY